MSSKQVVAVAERLDGYSKDATDMIDYLNETHPIPVYNGESHDAVGGENNAYLIAEPVRDRELASINLLISPSCTGQDTVIGGMEKIGCPVERVVTATTRPRRTTEPADAYVWMEEPEEGDEAEKINRLIARYGLVECQRFGQFHYGTPIKNLMDAANNPMQRPVVIKNDQYGAPRITERVRGEIIAVTVAMLPESYSQLWERLTMQRRDNPIGRLAEAAIFMTEFEAVSNYVLINKSHEDMDEGVRRTARGLRAIVNPEENS